MRNSSPVSSSSSLLNTTNRAKVIYRIEYREVTLSESLSLGKEKKKGESKRYPLTTGVKQSLSFVGQPQKTAFFFSFLRWFEFFFVGSWLLLHLFFHGGEERSFFFFPKSFFVPFLPLFFGASFTSKSHHLSDTPIVTKRARIYIYT